MKYGSCPLRFSTAFCQMGYHWASGIRVIMAELSHLHKEDTLPTSQRIYAAKEQDIYDEASALAAG